MASVYDLELHDHYIHKNFEVGRASKVREIVLHHNAGHGIDPYVTWQTREASAHCQLWGSGRIDKIVHFSDTAWHAHEANAYSIGLEHENSHTGGQWPIADNALHQSAKLVGYLCAYYKLGEPRFKLNVVTHHMVETDHVGVDSNTECPGPYFRGVLNNPNHWYWKEAKAAYHKKHDAPHPSPKPKPVAHKPPVVISTKSKGISAYTLAQVMSTQGHHVVYKRLTNRLEFDKSSGGPSFKATTWMAELNKALVRAHCTTPARVAMALAQLGAECGSFRYTEELASGSEYNWRSDLGNTHEGDGQRFKGRSYIQITGRYNYAALSRWAHSKGYVPTSTYFVDHPYKLAEVQYIFLGFVWYWTVARHMNSYADNHDIDGATKAVNGGYNNLSGRTSRWRFALTFGSKLLPSGVALAPTTKTSEIKHSGSAKVVTVHSGDTLSSIANSHHTTWQKLQQVNNIKNPNQIYIGEKIRIG